MVTFIPAKGNFFPDAILSADWHLRDTQPICRTDDFWRAQWEAVKFVRHIQRANGMIPIYHAGDLFHQWNPSANLIRRTILSLPDRFYSVYGQHDLPQHNFELRLKTGLAALAAAKKVTVLDQCHFGKDPEPGGSFPSIVDNRKVLIWHQMTWTNTKPFPGCQAPDARRLLRKYKTMDLIVTGDNHIPFVEEYEGRILVNPGSLTRQKADQIDHKPRIYLWDSKRNIVKPKFIPIEEGVITREQIEKEKERDARIQSFVAKLVKRFKGDLDFKFNLRKFEEENDISPAVMEIIWRALDNDRTKGIDSAEGKNREDEK